MNEWTRICVLRYVKDIAEYERRIKAGIERGQAIRAQMEGVGAVRYDRDGSTGNYTDRRPESLDLLGEIADQLDADIQRWARDAEAAHRIFEANEDTRIIWEHWGLKLKWAEVARRHCYSREYLRQTAWRGFEAIWHMMPEEYRRSPYPAEEWRGPYIVK